MVTRQPCSSFDALTALLEDQGFTAFDSRCIELNVRPYLPPKLTFKYLAEPKQTIFSNGGELTYTLKEEGGKCSGDNYKVTIDRVRNGADPCNVNGFLPNPAVFYVTGKILGLAAEPTGNLVYSNCDPSSAFRNPPSHVQYALYLATESKPTSQSSNIIIYFADFDSNNLDQLAEIIDIENTSNPGNDCIECTFTVTETFDDNSSIIRHQETRNICPVVEQFDCSLGAIQTIRAEAEPFEIFFMSEGYDPQDGLIAALKSFIDTSQIDAYLRGNPANCFLLWKLQKTGGISFIDIAQVCSDKACPPPEVDYQCLSCQENCPENTCPVECGDHICCYDSTGKSVKEITL